MLFRFGPMPLELLEATHSLYPAYCYLPNAVTALGTYMKLVRMLFVARERSES